MLPGLTGFRTTTGQKTVQLIISPGQGTIAECFIIVPGIVEIKIVLGSSTRSASLAPEVVLSARETGRGTRGHARLDTYKTWIDIKLGEGIDVLLGRLVCSLEIVSDVVEGLAKFGIVHIEVFGQAARRSREGEVAQCVEIDQRAEAMRIDLTVAILKSICHAIVVRLEYAG